MSDPTDPIGEAVKDFCRRIAPDEIVTGWVIALETIQPSDDAPDGVMFAHAHIAPPSLSPAACAGMLQFAINQISDHGCDCDEGR